MSDQPPSRPETPAAPRVSVLLVTYNQAEYVAQAVESVLSQELDGDWELIIADDCSTDGARAILEQFARREPQRIRLLLREQNLGLSGNLRSAWPECRGKYVAMLEGDDYWTDPRKLQKQADALDAHPEWSMCFHRIQVTHETGERSSLQPGDAPSLEPYEDGFPVESGLRDLLRRNFVGNVSTMYRRGIVPEIPAELQRTVHQDWPLHMLHARRGPIGYLPDVMGVWRRHSGSLWSSKHESVRWQLMFQVYDLAEDLLGDEYRADVRLARMESVKQLCADRERALTSRDYRYGEALLRPVRAIRRWLE